MRAITDEEIEDLLSLIQYLGRDYPVEIDYWRATGDQWKRNREKREQFDKFYAFIKIRSDQAKRRQHG